MKKIGILYICTGPYVLFWEDFFNSFEEKFIPEYEKHYFVFTDSKDIYASNNPRIHKYDLQAQPWPLVTLLRFNTFLSIEEELKKCDYLLFSNANIVCEQKVSADEVLPREEKGEDIFVTIHPGYYQKHRINYVYDRNPKSLAYIPWNKGEYYVIGAFFGGTSEAFISMSKTLKKNIEEDLKKNIIARWHDESHLNRYIVNRKSVRYISPEYCYPVGMNVTYAKRITGVSKQAKFDVKTFKGFYAPIKKSIYSRILLRLNGYLKRIKSYILYARDSILPKQMSSFDNKLQ